MLKDMHEKLLALASDPERIVEGERFWAVIMQEDGSFLPAWLEGNGTVRTGKTYRTAKHAATIASAAWGQ